MTYFKFLRTNFYDPSNYIRPRRILDEAVLVNNVDVHFLTEELHSFEGQLELTKEVSEHIYFMLNRDVNFQISNFSRIKIIAKIFEPCSHRGFFKYT